jgi:TonB family protein
LGPARQSYGLGKEIYDSESETVVLLANNLAWVLATVGQKDEVRKLFKISLKGAEKLYGQDSPDLVQILMDMASVTIRAYRRGSEMKYFNRALKITKRYYGDSSKEFGELNIGIGNVIMHKAMTNEGRRYTNRGLKILEKTEGEDSALYGLAAFQKAKYEMSNKQYREAETYFQRALDSFEKSGDSDNPFALTTHAFLVRVNEELGESDEATRHCLAIARMTPESEDQEKLPVYRKRPDYPRKAAERRLEGWVELIFDVDEAGFVVEPRVTANSGDTGFKDAALEAVKGYRYAPAFRDGLAVLAKDVDIRIIFKMAE